MNVNNFIEWCLALMMSIGESVVINMSILALWLIIEYKEYNELQLKRKSNNIIFLVYCTVVSIYIAIIKVNLL